MLNFVSIPSEVLERLKGKSKALHVLCILGAMRNVRTNETRFLSKTLIAELAGMSRRHIYRILSGLEAIGFIECVTERRGEYMWRLPCLATIPQKSDNVKTFMTEEEMKADTERMLKEMYSNG